MKVLLDCADAEQVRYWLDQGVIDGITTNPSILRRDGVASAAVFLAEISDALGDRPFHAEVSHESGQALEDEAQVLSDLAENVVVKVPVITTEGRPLLGEISRLVDRGIAVNCTACLSVGQVVLASKAGAQWASVLIGRIDDEGHDGARVVSDVRSYLDAWHLPAQIIAASVRGPGDFQRAALAGSHAVTVHPEVLGKTVDHHYSRHTVRQFLTDARGDL